MGSLANGEPGESGFGILGTIQGVPKVPAVDLCVTFHGPGETRPGQKRLPFCVWQTRLKAGQAKGEQWAELSI